MTPESTATPDRPLAPAYERLARQSEALSGGNTLTAVQFAELHPGPCPDCREDLTVAQVEVSTFCRGPGGRRQYMMGPIECPTGCF